VSLVGSVVRSPNSGARQPSTLTALGGSTPHGLGTLSVTDAFDHDRCDLSADIHVNESYLPGKVVVDYPGSKSSITCDDNVEAIAIAMETLIARKKGSRK